MLTRAQIQRVAQRNHTGIQVQERDYLQHLILLQLYRRSQALVFKGGTALRLVYRGNRYSEDLDFTADPTDEAIHDATQLRSLTDNVVADLKAYGSSAEIRDERVSEAGFSCDVSYQGPLYDGRDHSKGKVRLDISLRREAIEARRELVHSEYDDVRPFVVNVLTVEHVLAEKIRALLVRGKPRDLYDVWLLLGQGVQPDVALFDRKLALYDLTFNKPGLDAALEQVRLDWERDLRVLLPQFVEFEVVSRGIDPLRRLASGG